MEKQAEIILGEGNVIEKVNGTGTLFVPAEVTDIKKEILSRYQLSKIVFAEGIKRISSNWDLGYFEVMEWDDNTLNDIILPSTVEYVEKGAFSNYSGIRNVWVPDGMVEYFTNILPDNLKKAVKSNPVYIGNAIYSSDMKTLLDAKECEGDFVCAEGVEIIDDEAFKESNVTSVTLPASLKHIKGWAFSKCKKLHTINLPDGILTIGHYAFSDCNSLRHIEIPQSVSSIEDSLFSSCKSLETVVIPDNMTEFNGNAFDHTKLLFDLKIPAGVSSLGWMAFRWCSLTSITVPGSVERIDRSFYSLQNLHIIRICEGVKEITMTFDDCPKIKYIVLPASIEKMDDDVFKAKDEEYTAAPIFVPEGELERFKSIVPPQLVGNLREGDVPQDLVDETEQAITRTKADVYAELADEAAFDFFSDGEYDKALEYIDKAIAICPDPGYQELKDKILAEMANA